MSLPERLRPYLRHARLVAALTAGCALAAYGVNSTRRTIARVVRTAVLDREKFTPEYIYIDDPAYTEHTEKQESGELIRMRSFKHSMMWRLLWLCRHGGREQRNLALQQLAGIKKSKEWEYHKLAQALDAETAALLARTEGVDLRYFLPPPMHVRRAACSSRYQQGRFRQLLLDLKTERPHNCTDYFVKKYFANVKEETLQSEECKPDTPGERKLCVLSLDAAHHQLVAAETDELTTLPVHLCLLDMVAEVLERYRDDSEVQLSALRVLTALSSRPALLQHFHLNGLLGYLARWLRSPDARLCCSAGAALANLTGEGQYRGGLYLLHPLYRGGEPAQCDVLFLHGLRGGVFVTWRQRDPKNESPLGIFGKKRRRNVCGVKTDVVGAKTDTPVKGDGRNGGKSYIPRGTRRNSDSETKKEDIPGTGKESVIPTEDGDCNAYSSQLRAPTADTGYLADPDLHQVMEDLRTLEEEALLADLEVVVQDLPEYALRDSGRVPFTSQRKREALQQEAEDLSSYTSCWPKDWLPKDCPNLRVLGVDYWTSVSEWTGGCAVAAGELEDRAASLRAALRHAGVGRAPLVCVAHSMGGLVAERMLLDSANSDSAEERQLAERTRALVYYSTPHRGSTLASIPRATAALLWPSAIVLQLQEGSPMLLKLQKEFVAAAEQYGWETVCFGETKPTLVSAFKVPIYFVQAESADLGRGPFYKLPLDHLSICKPATRHSILYTSVVDILQRVVREEQQRKRTSAIESGGGWRRACRRDGATGASETEGPRDADEAPRRLENPESDLF